MASLINAHAIYDGISGKVLYDYPVVTINCENLAAFSPRPVAIKRRNIPGGFGVGENVMLTFDLSDPEIDSNTLFGYQVLVSSGGFPATSVVVDAQSVDAILAACRACCDDEAPVTLVGIYTSGVFEIGDPTFTAYTVTRMDDGTPDASNKFALDYWGSYLPGSIKHTSWAVSGVSTYTLLSNFEPTPVGSDSVS